MDARVAVDAVADAFGDPTATLTPPWENPFTATVIWLFALPEDTPVGNDYGRREPRWVVALRRDQVPVPRVGTIVNVARGLGEVKKDWQIDGIHGVNSEFHHVVLVPKSTVA